MDAITQAIIATISAGILSGTSKVSEQVISDSYTALKTFIKDKYGNKSDLSEVIEDLESKPESEGRKISLEEELVASGAVKDAELLALAANLLELLRDISQTKEKIAGNENITGNGNTVSKTTQKAGDNAVQIAKARDVNINK